MRFTSLLAFVLASFSVSPAYAGFQPAMGFMICHTLGGGSEIRYQLEIEKINIRILATTPAVLIKSEHETEVSRQDITLRSAPVMTARYVLTAPGVALSIPQSVDGKRSTSGWLTIGDQPFHVFCFEPSTADAEPGNQETDHGR